MAFVISSAFASLTITEDNDSYKLSSIENDSFEPNYIDEVPTIIEPVKTNITANNTTDTNDTIHNRDIDDKNDTWIENLTDGDLWDD
ncbi:hypothetical protein [Methanobrevibacter sp.]|uniref:hypothetical protein n=1 Tax=Methanobrevibacter sp. TaxID=66852 RepID=UPI00388F5CA6